MGGNLGYDPEDWVLNSGLDLQSVRPNIKSQKSMVRNESSCCCRFEAFKMGPCVVQQIFDISYLENFGEAPFKPKHCPFRRLMG